MDCNEWLRSTRDNLYHNPKEYKQYFEHTMTIEDRAQAYIVSTYEHLNYQQYWCAHYGYVSGAKAQRNIDVEWLKNNLPIHLQEDEINDFIADFKKATEL